MYRLAGAAGLLISLAGVQCWAQAPAITKNGVVPLYSTATTIQAGEWVSIYGTNLASSTVLYNGSLPYPATLGGTTVTIDGKPAFLYYVSSTLIDLIAPADTATGSVNVVVTTSAGSTSSTATLAQYGPSFFLLDSKHVAGIILRTNGSGAYGGGVYDIIGPTGNSLGYGTVAVRAGDVLELFADGLGPTNPVVPAGQGYNGAASTVNPVSVLIGNVSVTPLFAGLATQAGVYQINVTIPAGLPTGDVPLVATAGGVQTPSNVVISVQAGSEIQSLNLSANTVAGGGTVTGTVVLSGAAPSGGEVVVISGGSSVASLPTNITVPAGATSATFTVNAQPVSSSQTITITAAYGGSSAQAHLTVIPCATIGGNWNATESGTGTDTLTAAGETVSEPVPFSVSSPVTFTQSGCSIQLNPAGEGELLGTTASLPRTGTVTGNNVTLTGQATSSAEAESVFETLLSGLSFTSVNVGTNVMNATGSVSGNVMTLNETATFTASGSYSYEGTSGPFSITLTFSTTGTFNWANGTRPADHSPALGNAASATPDHAGSSLDFHGVVQTLIRDAFRKALGF